MQPWLPAQASPISGRQSASDPARNGLEAPFSRVLRPWTGRAQVSLSSRTRLALANGVRIANKVA